MKATIIKLRGSKEKIQRKSGLVGKKMFQEENHRKLAAGGINDQNSAYFYMKVSKNLPEI